MDRPSWARRGGHMISTGPDVATPLSAWTHAHATRKHEDDGIMALARAGAGTDQEWNRMS